MKSAARATRAVAVVAATAERRRRTVSSLSSSTGGISSVIRTNQSLFIVAAPTTTTTEGGGSISSSRFLSHSSSSSSINNSINVNVNAVNDNVFWKQQRSSNNTDANNNNQKRRYSSSNSSSSSRSSSSSGNSSSSSTNTTPDENNNKSSLLDVVETLAHRLNEPIPLRVTATTTSTTATTITKTTTSPSDTDTATTTTTTVGGEEKEKGKGKETQKIRLSELASELSQGYVSLPPLRLGQNCERSEILNFLGTKCCYGPSSSSLSETETDKVVEQYLRSKSNNNNNISTSIRNLRKVTTPTYEVMIDYVLKQNAVNGMGFIINLREDLLLFIRYLKHQQEEQEAGGSNEPKNLKVLLKQYKELDIYIKSLLQKWFIPGLLEHKRITYDDTSASIIEYIATKEAVHPIKSLNDLRNRLNPSSRRVYALFHPVLPNKPLVFVHVALLSSSNANNNDDNNDEDDKLFDNNDNNNHNTYDTAVFYSISNGVKGLSGVGLGEYLLKESINALQDENSNNHEKSISKIKTFVTLSPIPKFRNWLKIKLLKLEQQQRKQKRLGYDCNVIGESILSIKDHFTKLQQAAAIMIDADKINSNNNNSNSKTDEQRKRQQYIVLQDILCKLVSQYLVYEKYRGKPIDKVCGFHVGNGAEIYDIHFCADLSRNGIQNSYGIMVNYIYHVDRSTNDHTNNDGVTNNNVIQENQTNYECNNTIPISSNVKRWLEL
ncbi:malonyl-CoA decarboxylase [Fragilariopsis cylindrus CCMP1102]|uniref:Malonyl-CoA decarboxylase n=1 Tax=Fragilariopsis cylindrus CCMP1102 TaxID=635003 RepID=A0A1E7FU28_9STRA|nr:malonyl-CoA decarboxylase [Fragilariopsis cylindrus CCMP1102]|eukprot:OEU21656.1 malonyl-CoA decarboxylase [Fragilariopsis cylindrus CCMP1102]